ncbi:MAG TPA: trypsin-like peptidase domain-containing protein [Aggregatilinea sp.]|uniref:S1C family serine protease n=1 Tax=Aggregatilinea sp. TaxID=2806333 RepID=UPI002C60CF73|nr:trypsin-like peptidase domain-containing protein [Aggregatilinea sp.]HML23974.1 trypsin-like peptidase domain-containing protein [Aggregatilinea sp.]
MSKKLLAMIVSLVFAFGILLGAIGVMAQTGDRLDPLSSGAPYTANEEEQRIADVYQRVSQSVVNVSVTLGQMGGGTGTGFVIDAQGHIVTNNHVAGDADSIEVTFIDGTILPAELVGNDPDADLAVIQVDPTLIDLQPVTLADSSAVFVGQEVMAIGSPFGQSFTATTGIVSALGRSLQQESNFSLPELIQTDAAINPGNSGGPLLDMAGNVIGVNTAIMSQSESSSGIGFSIPSNTVRRIVPYLIRDGQYEHTWLGISGMTLRPEQADALDLPNGQRGVMVTTVTAGSPAAGAGLQPALTDLQTQVSDVPTVTTPVGDVPLGGDIITRINDQPVNEMDDLITYLEENTRPGDTATLTVLRDGAQQTIDVTLTARPTTQM